MDPKPLSIVINAQTISSFLSSDPNHLSIFDTLLESRITGVDSEIRTEYENGTVTRFPVLILCLDGLERLLGKHGKVKELLEEKIRGEGGQSGVYGRLVQNLPIARTGVLISARDEEVENLKKSLKADYAEEKKKVEEKLEAEYAASNAKLREEIEGSYREQLAKKELELQAEAALELANLKTRALTDATKDVARQRDELAEEFAQRKKVQEENIAEQLAKKKEKLDKENSQELAKLRQDLKNKAADDIDEWKRRLRQGNEEAIAKLKDKIRFDAREEETKLTQKRILENAANLKKAKEQLEKDAAEDLARFKETLRNEAADDLHNWKRQRLTNDSGDRAKNSEEPSSEELAKEKEMLGIEAAKELSTLQTEFREHAAAELRQFSAKIKAKANQMVEEQLSVYNKEFQKRTEINKKKFLEYRDKCIFSTTDADNNTIRLTDKSAIKLLAKNPTIFNKYKDLCLEALIKYKKGLKEEYQNHLKDIELECRAWLRQNTGSKLKVEVVEGLGKAITRGSSFHPSIALINEDVGAQITREVLQQEANELMEGLEAQHQISVRKGGLGLPLWDTQAEVLKLAIDDADILENADMLALDSLLDNMGEENFLGIPLKELRMKAPLATRAEKVYINVVEPQIPREDTKPAFCKTDQGMASGSFSGGSPAAHLEDIELGEHRAGIEQELHHKSHSSSLCEMGPPKLRPASLWYSTQENVFIPTLSGNQVTNMPHEGTVRPRMVPNARDSRSSVKGSKANPSIGEFRSANEIDKNSKLAEIESTVESILQLEPFVSRAFTTKQKIFETMYSGKTISEIYEILEKDKQVKRKRLPDLDGSDKMPLRKKTN